MCQPTHAGVRVWVRARVRVRMVQHPRRQELKLGFGVRIRVRVQGVDLFPHTHACMVGVGFSDRVRVMDRVRTKIM